MLSLIFPQQRLLTTYGSERAVRKQINAIFKNTNGLEPIKQDDKPADYLLKQADLFTKNEPIRPNKATDYFAEVLPETSASNNAYVKVKKFDSNDGFVASRSGGAFFKAMFAIKRTPRGDFKIAASTLNLPGQPHQERLYWYTPLKRIGEFVEVFSSGDLGTQVVRTGATTYDKVIAYKVPDNKPKKIKVDLSKMEFAEGQLPIATSIPAFFEKLLAADPDYIERIFSPEKKRK